MIEEDYKKMFDNFISETNNLLSESITLLKQAKEEFSREDNNKRNTINLIEKAKNKINEIKPQFRYGDEIFENVDIRYYTNNILNETDLLKDSIVYNEYQEGYGSFDNTIERISSLKKLFNDKIYWILHSPKDKRLVKREQIDIHKEWTKEEDEEFLKRISG